jgi:CHAT domain-containing protein
MAKCLYETGHMAEAKQAHDALLGRQELKELGDLYWVVLYDRGRMAEKEGSMGQGIVFYKQAIDVIERQRSTINTEASRIGFVGDKQQVYHRLIAVLVAEGQPAQAFEYVERAKARALVDLLASKQDFATSGATPQQVAMFMKDLNQVDEELRIPAASSDESGRRSARGVQVKANLQTTAPELASLVMVTETTSSTIQTLLEPDETLIEYYYQGDALYAFVVTRDRVQGVKLNGTNLAKEVEAFRKALQDPKSGDVKELSRNLYGRLIQPVAAQMTTKRLLLVGHGMLHYLPFAALSNGTDYLVDRYSIRLLPSASVLQFLKGRKAQKGGSLLAFGNPDLGDAKYDLKFAQDEVQTIAKSFPNTKVLVRREATKSAFKTLGPQFSYLHLATHGKFDPDAPLKSGLLLARDAQDDGFLSLGDLYSMRLNADLVTLSACETGLGKVNNGDDVVGLTRGFLYAGSSSIVASLWEVDDRATSLLMTEFYANLKKTDKREALRQAQLSVKKQYPHPFYWAAFQLTGLP